MQWATQNLASNKRIDRNKRIYKEALNNQNKNVQTYITLQSSVQNRSFYLNRYDYCFVHPIFSSIGFWYFGHFSCVIFFPVFFPSCPSCLAKCKQRFGNIFVTSSPKVTKNQKPKMGWTKQKLNCTYLIE